MINLIAEGHLRQRRDLTSCTAPGYQKAGASSAQTPNDAGRPHANAVQRLAERRVERQPTASR